MSCKSASFYIKEVNLDYIVDQIKDKDRYNKSNWLDDLIDHLRSKEKPVVKARPVIEDPTLEEAFQLFYSAGLPKKNPKGARLSFSSLVKKMKCDPAELAENLKKDIEYRLSTNEFGFSKLHPASYLNKERWLDDYETANQSNNGHDQGNRKKSAAERIKARNDAKYGQSSGGLGMAADGGDIRGTVGEGTRGGTIIDMESSS